MVEHMNAASCVPQSQSLSGSRHHRFSLLRWFRRRKPKHQHRASSSSSSSSSSDSLDSLDSLYSTATVRSFAFHSGARKQAVDAALRLQSGAVGPFAPGAVKLAVDAAIDASYTLPTAFSHRHQDLRTRYALHSGSSYISYDNLPKRRENLAQRVEPSNSNNDTLTSLGSSTSGTPRVHVRGKRRAPEPPVEAAACRAIDAIAASSSRGRRKRRPAPQPPVRSDTLSSGSSMAAMDSPPACSSGAQSKDLSNDTLVLRRGVLRPNKPEERGYSLSRSASASVCDSDSSSAAVRAGKPSSVAPRPWYKRNLFGDQNGRDSISKRPSNGDVLRLQRPTPLLIAHSKDDNLSSTSNSPTLSSSFPFHESSMSRLSFFRPHGDERKKDGKRKSGLSILTNISELDKEAAAIVQQEQARNRASMILQAARLDREFDKRMAANEEIVQEIVNSSLESSPRRNSRAFVGKLNGAFSNSFFSRSPKAKRYSNRLDDADRDFSRYLPARKASPPKMESAAMFTEVITPAVARTPAQPASADNVKFAETITKELDDVATGIARLRRELDDRPKVVENAAKPRNDSVRKSKAATDKRMENFDKEFTKIFDEIDRQLRPRDSAVVEDLKTSAPTTKIAVDRLEDVTSNGKDDDKSVSSTPTPKQKDSEGTKNEEVKNQDTSTSTTASVVRISGVDDKTTNDLKEMLKEMKHSLPKRTQANVDSNVNKASSSSSSSSSSKVSSTKVSSGVQTSGNVRRIVVKPSENIYANVNAQQLQPQVEIDLRLADNALPAQRAAATERPDKGHDDEVKLDAIKKHFMNTLAVNRLLRKLEAAIASGNHQQAALLAKELAQLKIHCSVVRQRSCSAAEKLKLSMYIEDKQAHQGPIPLQLPANMTLAQLKAKIQLEFEIPANVQRWIIGKNLADNDETSLRDLQATDNSAIFLYLVAPPDLLQDKRGAIEVRDEEGEKQAERVINEKNDEREIKEEIKPEAAAAVTASDTDAQVAPTQPQARQEKEESVPREDKLKRYEELMSLENCDVIVTVEPIECPVCLMIAVPGEGVILRDCLHSFCRDCVANTIRYCEEAEVKCPYRDADYTCDSTLQQREIKALVTAEVYQQHLAKSIAQAENNAGNNAFHCKTPDCPGWCIYDDDVNNFLCPVCKVNNCLTCQAIHMGKNCRQYQEELRCSTETDHESKRTAAMLEEMVDRGEALPCPTCAVVLMKKWGCDWLRCSMCKTEICWVTRGPRWGPAGKGDTSGGCKCGENGVKCHPKCNYCH